MKSLIQTAVAVAAVFVGTTGAALANLNVVPEPGSLALVGVALAGVALVARKGKK